ncbi:MAG: pullulanase-type alpha-1,6-glucosidase [Myxococcota bacterium]
MLGAGDLALALAGLEIMKTILRLGASLLLVASACGTETENDPGAGNGTGNGTGNGSGNGTGNGSGNGNGTIEFEGLRIHYNRVDASYDDWTVTLGGAVDDSLTVARTDDFGAVFELEIDPSLLSEPVMVQISSAAGEEFDEAFALDPSVSTELWHFSGAPNPLTREPPAIPGPDQVAVYYNRADGDYQPWGLHLWGDVATETRWTEPDVLDGIDEELGAYWVVDMMPGGDRVNIIVHAGDIKDPGPDMGWDISEQGRFGFITSGSAEITSFPIAGAITGARAHWLDATTLVWGVGTEGVSRFELRYDPEAAIALTESGVEGGTVVEMSPNSEQLPIEIRAAYPHLAQLARFDVPDSLDIDAALQSELVVVATLEDGSIVDATGVQTSGVIDQTYYYEGPLGATFEGLAPTLTVWAPTAQNVTLIRLGTDGEGNEVRVPMTRNAQGAWSVEGVEDWYGTYYRYEVEVFHPSTGNIETTQVTDPYSVSLSANSRATQIISLNDLSTMPEGWDALVKPDLEAPEDVSIYEMHVRDHSIFDQTVSEANRGKFMGFTELESDGMKHLTALAQAGLTVAHVLPAFDIATVDEDVNNRVELSDGFDRLCALNSRVPAEDCAAHGTNSIESVLAQADPASGEAQEIMGYLRGLDGFNWGYDPFHYTVPEGSYATDPAGPARIREFRAMVQAFASVGLRVALDVVYNHTNAAGLSEKSVLDKVVPGYYHRLNPSSGAIENSTCCQNTASEHLMMERLMVDSLVTWATAYKVDAFRFDLMGHHMVRNMELSKAALEALTMEADGVDGSKIYIYGEGWNFGEVQDDARGRNATQANLIGTGIGTFNDRLRDAARGGGPFDSEISLRNNQGYINGMVTVPNSPTRDMVKDLETLLLQKDQIRVGMVGNITNFFLVTADGQVQASRKVDYGGSPAAYTGDPQEVVNYVSKHDNQTLFDINAYKAPTGTSMADRVRMQNLGMSIVALGQGIPFFHAGSDMLRSKSMQRDSFDSGDWFNRIDFTYQTNNWNVGLPRADKDETNWPIILDVVADTAIAPQNEHIVRSVEHFRELLTLRSSSVLFRLRDKEQIESRIDFHNVGPEQEPGLIVQSISDGVCAGADMDPSLDGVVVMLNSDDQALSFDLPFAAGAQLHPVLGTSSDPALQGAGIEGNTLTIPALSAAVFVFPQQGAQGDVVPCNTRNQ